MPEGPEREARIAEIRAEVAKLKQQALAAGGLYVIGTERHESRRIDNQLRGRSGRQGDPGHSQFFLSLQDDLMRIFGSERMDGMLQKLGLKEDEAIVHPWINRALEKAQQKVEARNFDIRKNLLKFDDVMNDQRRVIFEQRIDLMGQETVTETVADMRHEVIDDLVAKPHPGEGLSRAVGRRRACTMPSTASSTSTCRSPTGRRKRASPTTRCASASPAPPTRRPPQRAVRFTPEIMRQVEKAVLLQTLDHLWREHLVTLDHLRQVIGFRGYAQRDPLNEYKTESFELFQAMLSRLREAVTGPADARSSSSSARRRWCRTRTSARCRRATSTRPTGENEIGGAEPALVATAAQAPERPPCRRRRSTRRTRPPGARSAATQPCPCGSGKKYKHCHGAASPKPAVGAAFAHIDTQECPLAARDAAAPSGAPAPTMPLKLVKFVAVVLPSCVGRTGAAPDIVGSSSPGQTNFRSRSCRPARRAAAAGVRAARGAGIDGRCIGALRFGSRRELGDVGRVLAGGGFRLCRLVDRRRQGSPASTETKPAWPWAALS